MTSGPLAAALAAFLLRPRAPGPGAVLGFERPADAFEPLAGVPSRCTAGRSPPPAAGRPPAGAADSALPFRAAADSSTRRRRPSRWASSPGCRSSATSRGGRTSSRSSFTVANERWFQEDTYAGGADKASHIFLGYIRLAGPPEPLPLPRQDTRAGPRPGARRRDGHRALVEVGDAYSQYGFAWETSRRTRSAPSSRSESTT